MPIATDPDATFDLVLKVDQAKPADEQSKLLCRFLSRRKMKQLRRLTDQAYDAKTDEECFRLLAQVLEMAIVGWRNVTDGIGEPIAFAQDALIDVLTDVEIWEIARSIPFAAAVGEREKKASSSSLLAAGAKSAPVAEASATMSPANPNP